MPEEKVNVTMLDVYNRIGEINGTIKTFMEAQKETNDVIFEKHRSFSFEQKTQDAKINSLLQTRRNQWKVVTLVSGSIAGVWELLKNFYHGQ